MVVLESVAHYRTNLQNTFGIQTHTGIKILQDYPLPHTVVYFLHGKKSHNSGFGHSEKILETV